MCLQKAMFNGQEWKGRRIEVREVGVSWLAGGEWIWAHGLHLCESRIDTLDSEEVVGEALPLGEIGLQFETSVGLMEQIGADIVDGGTTTRIETDQGEAAVAMLRILTVALTGMIEDLISMIEGIAMSALIAGIAMTATMGASGSTTEAMDTMADALPMALTTIRMLLTEVGTLMKQLGTLQLPQHTPTPHQTRTTEVAVNIFIEPERIAVISFVKKHLETHRLELLLTLVEPTMILMEETCTLLPLATTLTDAHHRVAKESHSFKGHPHKQKDCKRESHIGKS